MVGAVFWWLNNNETVIWLQGNTALCVRTSSRRKFQLFPGRAISKMQLLWLVTQLSKLLAVLRPLHKHYKIVWKQFIFQIPNQV